MNRWARAYPKKYKKKYWIDTPMSILEKLYLFLHRRVYASRLKSQRRFNAFVISVGNLSAGGTGKTPVSAFLAAHLHKKRPLLILRGYRGKTGKGILVTDGKKILATAAQAGDEAVLLARQGGFSVAAGSDRASLIEQFGDGKDIVILDDAFQNPSVFRNHELVLLDATVPLEKIRVFPAGRFRENLNALSRADTVLFTRVDQARIDQYRELRDAVSQHTSAEQFESIHEVRDIYPPLSALSECGAFCGIGNPESFFKSLESAGYIISRKAVFPDHHAFLLNEIQNLFSNMPENFRYTTTEKDYVRILEIPGIPPEILDRIHVLRIQLKILNGRENKFVDRVSSD